MRTPTLLLAGALLTAGCQQTGVHGDRSFRGARVTGDEYKFPRTGVYGTTSFRNPPSAGGDLAMRHADSARPASDRAPASPPPPRNDIVSTPRAEQPTSDNPRDELSRSTATAETESGAPHGDVTRAPEPLQRQASPPPAPTPQPIDRPAATTDRPADKPTPPRDADATAIAPSTPGGHDPERVARASSARYPDDLKPSDDLRAAATIDRATRTLRVTNYSDRDVRGGDLWVSETYVSPVPDITSGGSVAVPLNQFFNRDGRPLPALTDTSKLQLQSAGKLYNIPLHPDDLNK